MDGKQAGIARTPHRTQHSNRDGVVIDLHLHARSSHLERDRPTRCVSSGYMSEGCSCQASVPASVASAAWARELSKAAAPDGRFFHFAWEGEVWLGFGLAAGEIRGVYCPTHRAARDGRAAGVEAQHYAPPAARLAVSA